MPSARAEPAAPVWQRPWLPAALGALCFLNALGNRFAYDDVYIVERNPRIRSLGNVGEIFLTDWWQPQNEEDAIDQRQRDRLYRPLALFTFALDHALWGRAPFGFHLTNVLLHVACCAALYHFTWRLLQRRMVAWLAAAAFAVHPSHTEAVANLVGRAEVLAALFLLLGGVALLPRAGLPSGGRLAAAAFCFLLALLTKETAICYLPIAGVVLWLRARSLPDAGDGPALRGALLRTAVLVWPLLIYFPLRYFALDGHLIRDRAPSPVLNPLMMAGSVYERIWMSLEILGHYTRLVFAPARLSSNYGYAVLDPDQGPSGLTALGGAAGLTLVWLLRHLGARDAARRQVGALALVVLFSYGLISNTALLIGVAVAERFMYWPTAPALMLIALILCNLWARHAIPGGALGRAAPLLRVAGAGLLAALGLRTVVRNPDWYDTQSLFRADVATYPQAVELQTGAALTYLREARTLTDPAQQIEWVRRADAAAARALEIKPNNDDALRLRGEAQALLGNVAAARAYLEAAITFNSQDRHSRRMLEQLNAETATSELEALRAAAAAAPTLENRERLARALLLVGQLLEAAPLIEALARENPENVALQRLHGDALQLLNQHERAIEQYERVLQLEPADWQTHNNLTQLLASRDFDRAIGHAERAYELAPTEFVTIQNLAEIRVGQLRYDEALRLFELLRRGLPEGDAVRAAVDARIAEVRRMAKG